MKLTTKVNANYPGILKKLLSHKDSIWTTKELWEILKKDGYSVSLDCVQKHTRKNGIEKVKTGIQTFYGAKEAITKFKRINNL